MAQGNVCEQIRSGLYWPQRFIEPVMPYYRFGLRFKPDSVKDQPLVFDQIHKDKGKACTE